MTKIKRKYTAEVGLSRPLRTKVGKYTLLKAQAETVHERLGDKEGWDTPTDLSIP